MKYLSWFSEIKHWECTCIYPSIASIACGMEHFIVLQTLESGRGTRIESASYQHLNENRLHKYGVDMAGVFR